MSHSSTSTDRDSLLYIAISKKVDGKKCTRQSRKVLWVILSSLFFKEISKNGTRGHGRMFERAKGKQQKWIRQLQCQEKCIDISYPILPFGIVASTVYPTTILEIAVYAVTSLPGGGGGEIPYERGGDARRKF